MGHVPIPPRPMSAAQALAQNEYRWKRAAYGHRSWRPWARDRCVAGRRSVLPWRRRAAHEAVLTLIKAREAILGMRPDPWKPKPLWEKRSPSPLLRDPGKPVRR
jgi:hypothetical protein